MDRHSRTPWRSDDGRRWRAQRKKRGATLARGEGGSERRHGPEARRGRRRCRVRLPGDEGAICAVLFILAEAGEAVSGPAIVSGAEVAGRMIGHGWLLKSRRPGLWCPDQSLPFVVPPQLYAGRVWPGIRCGTIRGDRRSLRLRSATKGEGARRADDDGVRPDRPSGRTRSLGLRRARGGLGEPACEREGEPRACDHQGPQQNRGELDSGRCRDHGGGSGRRDPVHTSRPSRSFAKTAPLSKSPYRDGAPTASARKGRPGRPANARFARRFRTFLQISLGFSAGGSIWTVRGA